jgi:hypothetical protein
MSTNLQSFITQSIRALENFLLTNETRNLAILIHTIFSNKLHSVELLISPAVFLNPLKLSLPRKGEKIILNYMPFKS